MSESPWADVPPPKSSKTGLLLIVGLAVVGAVIMLVVLGAGLFFVLKREGHFAALPPRQPPESLAEKRQASAEAFGQGDVKNEADADAVNAFSVLLQRTVQIATPQQAEACFDFDRMFEEFCSQLGNAAVLRSREERKDFKKGMLEHLVSKPPFGNIQAIEVRNVKPLTDADNVMVYTKLWRTGGRTKKMRWWACRVDGDWRWYDYEYLDIGLRLTATQAAVAGNTPQQESALDRVNKAGGLIAQSKFEEAGSELRATLSVPLPKAFDAMRHWELAIVELDAEKPEEALNQLDQAQAVVSDIPMLAMLRARAFKALGRFEEAEAQARNFLADLGSDDFGSWLLGTSLAAQGKKAEAADAFRAGFTDNPSSVDDLVGLASVLSDEQMPEIADRFAKFDRPKAYFANIAGQLIANENAATLAVIIDTNRQLAPRDPHNDYYEGELHWMQKDYAGAAEAFRKAVVSLPDDERPDGQLALRNSLLYAGQPVEAYEALPDTEDTFRVICNRLVSERQPDNLEKVCALHAERKPDDPWLAYFRAEVLVLRGECDAASAALRPLLSQELPEGLRDSCRDEFLISEINAGRPLEAYRTVPEAEDAFLTAANRLVQEGNADDLEKLVALHEQRQPDDPYLTYFRGEAPRLRGDFNAAVTIFASLVGRDLPDGLKLPCLREYLRCMSELDKAVEGYRAVPDAAFALRFLGDLLLEEWDGDTLDELIAAHTERLPDDPWLVYYRARALMMQRYYNRAAELLQPSIETAADEELKRSLTESYSDALLYGGKPLEAYLASIDRQQGFERVATHLASRLDAETLTTLISQHAADHPDDRLVVYFKACVADINDDYHRVAELLKPELAANDENADRARTATLLRNSLNEIHQPLEAYQALRPEEGFALAWRLAESGDLASLEQLVAAHEVRQPNDARLPYFRGCVARLKGDHEAAAAAFTEWFKLPSGNDDDEEAILNSFVEGMAAARCPLQAYSEADRLRIFRPLAAALARRNEIDLLDELIEAHSKAHTDDPWIGYWRGRSALLRSKQDDALAAYQGTLRSSGGDHDLAGAALREFVLLGKPLDGYRVVASAPEANWAFEYLADILTGDQDFQRLEELIAAHEEAHADDSHIAQFKAERLSALRKHEEAVQLLKPLVADADDADADYRYQTIYEKAMLALGRWRELYDAAGDKKATFASLASSLDETRDAVALRELIDAHRTAFPNEPLLAFYTGKVLRLEREYDEADRIFAEMATDLGAESLWTNAKNQRIETRFEAGKAVSAYAEIGPRRATFNALLNLCRDKRNSNQFEQLVTAHRQQFANDADLPQWELEILELKGDDEALLRALDQPSAPLTESAEWSAFSMRVRALVRLKRFDEARTVVADYEHHTPVPYFRAMVEASAGNVPAATVALDELLRSYYGVQDLYQDALLGPALRSDAFADFRERHPEWIEPIDDGHSKKKEPGEEGACSRRG
jgi:predicted Zn-dependent protease